MPWAWGATAATLLGACAVLAAPPSVAAGTTERVSVGPGGVQANDTSQDAAISADGRFVAFFSVATNLVPSAPNFAGNVFVRDRRTRRTELVSVGPSGAEGNQVSILPTISADGRFVAFISNADDLVPGDTNGVGDVFVRDRQGRRTERVSVATDSTQANDAPIFQAISPGGRYVAFSSDATNLVAGDSNGTRDVFVHDRQTGRTDRVSVGRASTQANGFSDHPSLSAEGRYAAFLSAASNLVPGDGNGRLDVFVHDRVAKVTTRVRVGSDVIPVGPGPRISNDGRVLAFLSPARNLVPGDTNGALDVFVRDRPLGRTVRVSFGPGGVQANDASFDVAIAPGGNHVGFVSSATNLVPGDTNRVQDVFVRDRPAGRTARVSVAAGGGQADGPSEGPAVAASARFVAFTSRATNLVPGDTNGVPDVFVHTR